MLHHNLQFSSFSQSFLLRVERLGEDFVPGRLCLAQLEPVEVSQTSPLRLDLHPLGPGGISPSLIHLVRLELSAHHLSPGVEWKLHGDGSKLKLLDWVSLAQHPAGGTVDQDAVLVNHQEADISVAVATPAGLITPIVRNAGEKTVPQISSEVKELAGKAKENKLKLNEFQGGTFTISNLGMFGISEFTAIINAPQLAILAVGGGKSVFDPVSMQPTTVMKATLSFDQRHVDDATAAEFMRVFRIMMERPDLLNIGYMSSVKMDRMSASL